MKKVICCLLFVSLSAQAEVCRIINNKASKPGVGSAVFTCLPSESIKSALPCRDADGSHNFDEIYVNKYAIKCERTSLEEVVCDDDSDSIWCLPPILKSYQCCK